MRRFAMKSFAASLREKAGSSTGCVRGSALAIKALLCAAAFCMLLPYPAAATALPKLETGYRFGVLLATDGTLWSWGRNTYGDTGHGNVSENEPVQQIGGDNDWIDISVGAGNFALKEDGSLWWWGDWWKYSGSRDNSNFPLQLGDEKEWVAIASASADKTVAIKRDGTLWEFSTPQESRQIGNDSDWASIVAGSSHFLALKTDGTLWGWGNNSCGQVGDGNPGVDATEPVQIGSDADWQKIYAEDSVSMAIKADGSLWSWGLNWEGYLAHGVIPYSMAYNASTPKRVGTDTWREAGYGAGIKTDGSLWRWGRSYTDHRLSTGTPQKWGDETSWVAVGNQAALKDDGTVWVWGDRGELIHRGPWGTDVPIQIGTDDDWGDVLSGVTNGLALKKDGTLYSWGDNARNQLSMDYDVRFVNYPTQIVSDMRWEKLSTTTRQSSYNPVRTTLGLATDGTLWELGRDSKVILKKLDIGSTPGLEIKAFSVNDGHYFVILSDGTLWGWGDNYNNDLGLGYGTTNSSITQIGSDADWRSVSSRYNGGIAIKEDGTLWSWGGDRWLGKTYLWTPRQIGGDTDWVEAEGHLAKKEDGSLWYVNDGLLNPYVQAVEPGFLWKTISPPPFSLGGYGIKDDGSLWSFVSNNSLFWGREIKQVGIDNDWEGVSSGESIAFALKSDGTIWGLGAIKYLGLGPRMSGVTEAPLDLPDVNFDRSAPYVELSPAPGFYSQSLQIRIHALDETDSSPAIYYTLDGSDPSVNGLPYEGPFDLDGSATVAAVAVDKAGNISAIADAVYTINRPPVPTAGTLSVVEGETGSVQVNPGDPDVGDTPTYGIVTFPSNGSAHVNAGGLFTYKPNADFLGGDGATIEVVDQWGAAGRTDIAITVLPETVPPVTSVTPAPGEYHEVIAVELSAVDNLDPHPVIHYTLDGSTPTLESPVYCAPIALSDSATVSYFAVDRRGNASAVQRAEYVVRIYEFIGFLPPVGKGALKVGRTVPLKFQLKDWKGNLVGDVAATLSVLRCLDNACGVTGFEQARGKFRYDEEDRQYIHNLSTKGMAPGYWMLRVTLENGARFGQVVELVGGFNEKLVRER